MRRSSEIRNLKLLSTQLSLSLAQALSLSPSTSLSRFIARKRVINNLLAWQHLTAVSHSKVQPHRLHSNQQVTPPPYHLPSSHLPLHLPPCPSLLPITPLFEAGENRCWVNFTQLGTTNYTQCNLLQRTVEHLPKIADKNLCKLKTLYEQYCTF